MSGIDALGALARARTLDNAAAVYADLLRGRVYGIEIDWHAVNAAIIERWSIAGLRTVKQRAYALAYPAADTTEQT